MSGMILWIPFILEDSGDTNIKERQNKQSYYSLFYQLHNTHIHILLNALYHNYGKILGNKTNFYTHSLSLSLFRQYSEYWPLQDYFMGKHLFWDTAAYYKPSGHCPPSPNPHRRIHSCTQILWMLMELVILIAFHQSIIHAIAIL